MNPEFIITHTAPYSYEPLPCLVRLMLQSWLYFSAVVLRIQIRFLRLSNSIFISSLKRTCLHFDNGHDLTILQNVFLSLICFVESRGFLTATFHSSLFANNLFLTKDEDAVFPFDSFHWFAKTWEGLVRFFLTKRTRFLLSFAVNIRGLPGLGLSFYEFVSL